jgi:hypothetical protein
MIDAKPGFGLPLVYHLVQQGMLDLGPCMPRDVTPADGDIEWASGPDVNGELTQAGAHAAREPDRDLAQGRAEVLRVQLPMKAGEPVQEDQIPGASPLPRARPRPRWGVQLHRKRQELAFGCSAARPRNPRVEEPDNGFQHTIGGISVAPVNPENALIEAEHHRTVGVGDNSLYLPQAEHGQAIPEQQVQFLTR